MLHYTFYHLVVSFDLSKEWKKEKARCISLSAFDTFLVTIRSYHWFSESREAEISDDA